MKVIDWFSIESKILSILGPILIVSGLVMAFYGCGEKGKDKIRIERLEGTPGMEGKQGIQGKTGEKGDPSTVAGPKGDQGDRGERGEQGEMGPMGPGCELAESDSVFSIACGDDDKMALTIPKPKLMVCLCTAPYLLLTRLLLMSEINEMSDTIEPPFVLHIGRCRVPPGFDEPYELDEKEMLHETWHPNYRICR